MTEVTITFCSRCEDNGERIKAYDTTQQNYLRIKITPERLWMHDA
jgi:hypothetical protein